MKRGTKLGLGLLFVVVLLAAAGIAGWLVWGLPPGHVRLFIDGEPVGIPPLGAGHWLVAVIGLVFAMFAVLVLVPLAVALGIGLPLAAAALVLALIAAPFALAGWALWRMLRRPRGDATMRG